MASPGGADRGCRVRSHTARAAARGDGNLYADLRAWVEAFLVQLADPVTRAAIPGLLVAYHRDETLYERLVSRSEEDVRAQLVELLAADGSRSAPTRCSTFWWRPPPSGH
ncbi:transcriptional regulator, TetR family protein [Mycobacterium xenopi 4042]|uniref:Transcriptional regulator, TetR family protein n=1 Tax=Mycobacterium xenopi 4042 TaxID=1299334 RepID=X8EWL6_MYCXE|nr:transcriptional regulator, TetR family protein [Mycobacterium xenopi 4042]